MPFGYHSGIEIETDVYRETEESIIKQSAESVATDGALVLSNEIESEASAESELISISHKEEFPDDDTVIVTVTAEYVENIAEKIKGNQ